jgi:hypothetical protein
MGVKETTGKENLGYVFLKELVKAASWAVVFLFFIVTLALGFKQDVKEAIDFAFKRAITEVYFFATDPEVKQDIKEAVEFMSEQSSRQVKKLIADPDFKQDLKEAIDLWHAYKYKKVEPVGHLGGTQ